MSIFHMFLIIHDVVCQKNEYIFNAVIGSGVSVFDQSTSWNVLFKRIVPKSDLMHVLHYKIT